MRALLGWGASLGVVLLGAVFVGVLLADRQPASWVYAAGVFFGLVAEGVRRELR